MELQEGMRIPDHRVDGVDAERMKTMALILRDPNPIHWDVDVVRQLGLGDAPVNQGPLNLAYVMNALLAWTGDAASIRSITLRFQGNVFAGDVVVAGGRVTAVRQEAGEQIADCEVWLDRDDGTRVLSGTATVAAEAAA